ncbi:MAG TPA: helix-turn-helix transcriptional regulator [Caproicibacter sp.]|nr:helix-turn-helix transcriptional regulator [Caproicibacter sp.]
MNKSTELNAKELASKIDALCKDKGTTINKMLEECGLSKSVVDNMKRDAMPSIDKLFKISNYFGITIDDLIGNEQKNKPSANAKGLSEGTMKLANQIEQLSPANRAKLEELCRLYLDDQCKKK